MKKFICWLFNLDKCSFLGHDWGFRNSKTGIFMFSKMNYTGEKMCWRCKQYYVEGIGKIRNNFYEE